MKTKIAYTLLILCGCIACTPTVSDNAKPLLDDAISHYANGMYNTAKMLIDSIHATYPKNVEVRRQARNLLFQIEKDETNRTLAYMDSILPIMQSDWEKTQAKFVITDTTYLPKPYYQHKTFAKQAPGTTLYCEVAEQGDMQLISSYQGQTLDHVALKVTHGDVYAATDTLPIGSVYNNQFTDLGVRWEYLTFDTGRQADVAGFIAMYADKTLKVTLYGKRKYTYYLSKASAKAFKESVDFASQTKQLYQLKQEYKKLTDKKIWLEQTQSSL